MAISLDDLSRKLPIYTTTRRIGLNSEKTGLLHFHIAHIILGYRLCKCSHI